MATGLVQCLSGKVRLLANPRGPVSFGLGVIGHAQRQIKQKAEELFPPRLILSEKDGFVPTLSPPQVTSLLTVNEDHLGSQSSGVDSVRSFDSNQLGSNYPIEDRRSVAKLMQTPGTLFSVIDGHAGSACAQSVSERLFEYVAVGLLPPQLLEAYSHGLKTDSAPELLQRFAFRHDYHSERMSSIYRANLQKFVVGSLSMSVLDDVSVSDAIRAAFVQLDADISAEAMPMGGIINEDSVNVSLSGACACMAHINGLDIHVANVGDSRCIIGRLDDDGKTWVAEPLSTDHNCENEAELSRVLNAHPASERGTVIRHYRLLGQLIPLRAFGDVRFKWNSKDLSSMVTLMDGTYSSNIIPPSYYSPPYLTAEPELTQYRLQKNDRFLILATDGLWETMSNDEVVSLVGKHLVGRETKEKFKLEDIKTVQPTLRDINKELLDRKGGLKNKAIDENVATHLLRHALGKEHGKVSKMLTFPPDISRYYRDDITVEVVYFDTDYLNKHA